MGHKDIPLAAAIISTEGAERGEQRSESVRSCFQGREWMFRRTWQGKIWISFASWKYYADSQIWTFFCAAEK